MPNELPLPEDLQHLIEKRSGNDRRQTNANAPVENTGTDERRSAGEAESSDRRSTDPPLRPGSIAQSAGNYRCDCCLTVVSLDNDRSALPSCPQCGVAGVVYKRVGSS